MEIKNHSAKDDAERVQISYKWDNSGSVCGQDNDSAQDNELQLSSTRKFELHQQLSNDSKVVLCRLHLAQL